MESTGYTAKQLKVIKPIVEDLGERFKESPHNQINFTISLKKIKLETGVNSQASFRIVRYFLRREGKYHDPISGGAAGSKYPIHVTREEYERWKRLIESM